MKGTLYEGLLPAGAAVAEALPAMWEQGLWPEELVHMQGCAQKRRREFTAGRNCVRAALRLLGLPESAIGMGVHREPLLPSGLVGSITHTDSYCAAALLDGVAGLSIGIDAEHARPLGQGVCDLVLRPAERAHLSHLARSHGELCWDTLMFSAKESFHKALFRRWPAMLEFLDAEVEVDAGRGLLEVRLPDPEVAKHAGGNRFTGRFRFAGDLVLSAMSVRLD